METYYKKLTSEQIQKLIIEFGKCHDAIVSVNINKHAAGDSTLFYLELNQQFQLRAIHDVMHATNAVIRINDAVSFDCNYNMYACALALRVVGKHV